MQRPVESLDHTAPVSAVRFTSEDELLSASWDHTIKFWDIQSSVNSSSIVRTLVDIF